MACTIRQAYNSSSNQQYVAVGTTVELLGNTTTKCGCDAQTVTSGFQINRTGVYRVSFDVTSTPSAAGVQILQMYSDSKALPCAISQDTVTETGIITQHVETVLKFVACSAIQPIVSVKLSGVSGTVNNVKANLIREA